MMNNISAVVIDDEAAAREILLLYLDKHCPHVNVLGSAGTFADGLALLERKKPDIVFLDVELNDAAGGGLELLERFEGADKLVSIFFTGYDKYVEDSYRLKAAYYVKKPVSIVALKEAVERAKQMVIARRTNHPIFYKLSTQRGIEFVALKDIVWLSADGSTTHIHTISNCHKMSSETLGEIERQLPPKDFYRVHRSHIINRAYVREYQKDGVVVLNDGTTVGIAAGQVKGFLSWFLEG